MNTTRVNLLPHREERRKRSRQHFMTVSFGTAVIGAMLAGMVYQFYARQIEHQIERNTFLTNEIKKLDKDIADINELRNQIQALLARKQIIETLQTDRAQTVNVLEQLVRQMPEGVFLKSMKQTGGRIDLLGYAQSNARVSTLMRNIEASPWLTQPVLVEVKASNVDKRRIAEFSMYLNLKRAEPPKDAAKPAAKKG
jgi:type IV pilus assembly protein PilN